MRLCDSCSASEVPRQRGVRSSEGRRCARRARGRPRASPRTPRASRAPGSTSSSGRPRCRTRSRTDARPGRSSRCLRGTRTGRAGRAASPAAPDREVPAQARGVDVLRRGLGHERDEPFPQAGEDLAHLGRLHPLLEVVQEGVVGLVHLETRRVLAAEGRRCVRGRAGRARSRWCAVPRPRPGTPRRPPGSAARAARPGRAAPCRGHGGRPGSGWPRRTRSRATPRTGGALRGARRAVRDDPFVHELGDRGQLPCADAGPLRRHHRLLVPPRESTHLREIPDLGQIVAELEVPLHYPLLRRTPEPYAAAPLLRKVNGPRGPFASRLGRTPELRRFRASRPDGAWRPRRGSGLPLGRKGPVASGNRRTAVGGEEPKVRRPFGLPPRSARRSGRRVSSALNASSTARGSRRWRFAASVSGSWNAPPQWAQGSESVDISRAASPSGYMRRSSTIVVEPLTSRVAGASGAVPRASRPITRCWVT